MALRWLGSADEILHHVRICLRRAGRTVYLPLMHKLIARVPGPVWLRGIAMVVGGAFLASVGCAGEAEQSRVDGTPMNNGSQAGNGSSAGGSGSGGVDIPADDDTGTLGGGFVGPAMQASDEPIPEEEVCVSIEATAEPVPVDLYVMLDQSVSMAEMTTAGGTRWDAVTNAISSFVADDRAAGIGVGIDYFGIGFDSVANCDPSHYADPDVGIDLLPDNRDALLESLGGALGPASNSRTPTYAALEGALQYASEHAAQLEEDGSNRQTAVLLASDGFPTECEQSLAAISTLSADAYAATPPVITHMIALTEGEANARAIAEAGGGQSFIITDMEDVAQRFLDAMLSITTTNIPCSHVIERETEDGGLLRIDSLRANVFYTPNSTGQQLQLPQRADRTACRGTMEGGYYFDDPSDPTQVVLCDRSCQELGAGELDILLTCVEDDGMGPIE